MPRYDYQCPQDGEFEAAVRFADADKPQPCPKCRKRFKRVARLYPANINYCDGMTKHSAVIDSENTKKHGHTI